LHLQLDNWIDGYLNPAHAYGLTVLQRMKCKVEVSCGDWLLEDAIQVLVWTAPIERFSMAIWEIPEDLEAPEVPVKVKELNLRLNSLSLTQILSAYIIPTQKLVLTIKEKPDVSDI
jgi:hypothetical protein